MSGLYRSRGASPLQLMISLAIGLSLIASGFHYYSAMLVRVHQDQDQIELVNQFDMAEILLRDAFERADYGGDVGEIVIGENISAFEITLLRYPIHWYRFEDHSSDRLSDQYQDQSLQDGNRNTGGLRLARSNHEKSEYYIGGVRYVARESDLLIGTEKVPLGYWMSSDEVSLSEVLHSAIERAQIVSGKYPPLLWATNGETGVLFKVGLQNKEALGIASADLRQIKVLSATALKGSATPIFLYQLQSKQFYTLKERGEHAFVIDGFDGQAFIRIPNMIRFRLAVFNKNTRRWEYDWDLDETNSALISVELIGGVGEWESLDVEFLYRESAEVEMITGINHHPKLIDARRLLFYLSES